MRDQKGRFVKGHPTSNTGRTWIKKGQKVRLGSKHSEVSKKKMSEDRKGKMPSNLEFLRTYKRPRGEKSHMWRGGLTDESKTARKRAEYVHWRASVYERDDFTCQKCLERGGKLHPHHILNFRSHIELRYSLENGITLCIPCHRRFHKLYGNRNNNRDQINEYIQIHNR